MDRSYPDPDALDLLAEEFVTQHCCGKRPAISEYIARYPQYAETIRYLFTALVVLERLKPEDTDQPEAYAAASMAVPARLDYLGDYRIIRELGRGGMGVVYEAEQESLGRHVALKVLGPQALLDFRQLMRFHREAKAAAQLHHTNIVPVFGVGQHRGLHYYAMQYIAGQGLDQVIDELRRLRRAGESRGFGSEGSGTNPTNVGAWDGRPSAARIAVALASDWHVSPAPSTTVQPHASAAEDHEALAHSAASSQREPADISSLRESRGYWHAVARIGVQVADALAYAHGQGIFHRDIKPSNLLMDTQGIIWITDFGLAKSNDSDDLTHTGDVVGTIRYMAPERFRGQADGRSDLYSLGLTLYELLALRPAFDPASRERMIEQVTQATPLPPRHWNRRVPADLETVVLKAMAKEPEDRYATASDLAEDLRRFLQDEPIRARRAGIWERGRKWVRRHQTTTALLGVIALVASLGFAGVTWEWLQAEAARRVAAERASVLESNLYFNSIALAEREWADLNFHRAEEVLSSCPPSLRGWEWACLKRLCQRPPVTLRAGEGRPLSAAFTPDGSRLATVEAEVDQIGVVKVWDAETGRVLRTIPGGRTTLMAEGVLTPAMAIRPDGLKLAVASQEQTVSIRDLSTGREDLAIPNDGGITSALAFSPDGQTLAVAGHGLVLRDPATGREVRELAGGREFVTSVAFHPDGRRLAWATNEGNIVIWDLPEDRATLRLHDENELILWLTFDPDGRHLASAGDNGTIRLWDVTTGHRLHVLTGHARTVQCIAFSPDGCLLASAGQDQTIRLWDAGTGRERLTIHGHDNAALGVAFSSDGARLASTSLDGTAKVWDTRVLVGRVDAAPARVLTGHTTLVRGVDFSPDGRRLASVSADRTLKIWDVSSGRLERDIRGRAGWLFGLAFAPDGRRVATVGDTPDGRLKDGIKGEVIVWDVATGREVMSLPGRMCVAFSRDGRRLAAMAAKLTLKIWDAEKGREERVLQGPTGVINSVTFSPDGARLAAGGGDFRKPGEVIVWDLTSGRLIRSLQGLQYPVHWVAYSPDGTRLVTAGGAFNNPGELRVWDAASGHEVLSLKGHAGSVSGADFSPDGRTIASSSRDRTVRIWDAITGQQLLTLHDHTSIVHCVAFSPNGTRLASGSYDKTIRLRDTTSWPKPARE